ncbi:Unknown protein, partial [Striga hermonthica]
DLHLFNSEINFSTSRIKNPSAIVQLAQTLILLFLVLFPSSSIFSLKPSSIIIIIDPHRSSQRPQSHLPSTFSSSIRDPSSPVGVPNVAVEARR